MRYSQSAHHRQPLNPSLLQFVVRMFFIHLITVALVIITFNKKPSYDKRLKT